MEGTLSTSRYCY